MGKGSGEWQVRRSRRGQVDRLVRKSLGYWSADVYEVDMLLHRCTRISVHVLARNYAVYIRVS